jgi:hypothetical protein
MPSLSSHGDLASLLAGSSPAEALAVSDVARQDEIAALLARLRATSLRFATDGPPSFPRAPAERAAIELTLGEALDGARIPANAMAIDVPLTKEASGQPAWLDAGATLTLWAAPAGATLHARVLDARADVLLVGLAGAIACVVFPSARRQRLDVFPDRPDVSAVAVEAMTPGEREEFVTYAGGGSAPIASGQGVWIPAGSFVFLDWRERGAFVALRRPRSAAEVVEGPATEPHTVRQARARPPEDRWIDGDRVRLTDGVPLYAIDAEAGVRVALVRDDVAVLEESFVESSLRFRILDFILGRPEALVTVDELRTLAGWAELSRELGLLRRDGWVTRVSPEPTP